jgi:hypothetical protein
MDSRHKLHNGLSPSGNLTLCHFIHTYVNADSQQERVHAQILMKTFEAPKATMKPLGNNLHW